jgi:hypothetical protein
MAGSPARRAKVRRILVMIILATIPIYCLGFFVLQRVQAQLKVNFSTPSSSATRVETLQVFVPATSVPGPASTFPVQDITPTLSSAPEDFIRQYFQLIDQRAYSQTWAMLSDHYRQLHNPTGYQPYVDFWNTTQGMGIGAVQVVTQDQNSARLLVQLIFHFTNGKSSTQSITFNLVADAVSGSWLIDDTY